MIGADLVFIPDFKKQLSLGGDTFLKKAYSANELKNQEIAHLAGLWAAKEAVFKAASGIEVRPWSEIDISNDKSGRPYTILDGIKYEISISHVKDYAMAVAIEVKNEI